MSSEQSLVSVSDIVDDSPGDLNYLFNTVYFGWVIECVRFSEVISKVPFMRPIAHKIYALENEGKTKEAGSLFMDAFKASEEPGKYPCLLQALKDLDYSFLVNAIEHGVVDENHEEHKKILEIFMDPLMEKISPDIMAHRLVDKGIISSNDADKIVKTERNRGGQQATFELLDAIPRKKENWYRVFWDELYDLGHHRLCKEIDPKLFSLKGGEEEPSSIPVPVPDHLLRLSVRVPKNFNFEGRAKEQPDTKIIQHLTHFEGGSAMTVQRNLNPPLIEETVVGRSSSLHTDKDINARNGCKCSCAQDIDKKFEELKTFFEAKFNNLESKFNQQCKLLDTLLNK